MDYHDRIIREKDGSVPMDKEWWAYMSDIMETNPDNSPVATPLEKVCHME